MWAECVKRLVVESGHDFGDCRNSRACHRIGSACNLRPPDLLRPRFHSPREPFPGDGELLVRPGHVDRLRLHVQPAVADHPRPHGESTAVFVAHLHADRPLRSARLGPEAVEGFPGLRDLDVRATGSIAGADDRRKFVARFNLLLLRRHYESPLHAIAFSQWIDHLDQPLRLHRRHVTGCRNLEHRLVDARRELCRGHEFSGGFVGRYLFRHHRLADGPGLGIGGIRWQRLWRWSDGRPTWSPAAGSRHGPGWSLKKITAVDVRRLHELVDSEHARSRVRLTVERGRGERDRDSHWPSISGGGLPGLGRERRLDICVAGAHGPLVATRFAALVGNVGDDTIGEDRQRLLRHAAVGLCGEGDGEDAIGIGDRRASRDSLTAAVKGQAREEPAAPDRPAGRSLHLPADLCACDRHARVGRGRA